MEQSAKILAVEDDIFLKELLAGRFSEGDFTIFHASTGDEALELAQSEKPDVILLDIILPGMSGFEVLEKLKADEATAGISVIILSNLGSEDDIKKGKELGAIDFLIKANNSLDAIVERIRKALSENGVGNGNAKEGTSQPQEEAAQSQETSSETAPQQPQEDPDPQPQPQPESERPDDDTRPSL